MDITTLLITILLLVIPLLYYMKTYLKWKNMADLVNKIPGPKTYPLIGTTWDLLVPRKDIVEVFMKRTNEYKPLFRSWLGPIPEIHLMTAEHMEAIMSSTKIIDKGIIYKYLHPWLGTGLLTSSGVKWHSRRKLITPTFHFKILENFVEVFIEKSEILAEQLKSRTDGKVFDVCPYVTRCALDIICETAMGVEVHAMSKTNSDYVTAIHDISEIIMQRGLKPWLTIDWIFYKTSYGKRFHNCLSLLHGFTEKVIQERKAALKGKNLKQLNAEDELLGKKHRMAFLDLLLEATQNGANLSDSDIREEVDTFMFEGHDTTTAGITWTLFLLGNHPDVQDKVAEELEEIFGKEDRPITMQDLTQMKYLERVIKESLRLYPSVPFIMRHVNETIVIDGYTIPPGCVLVLHIRDLHRDPKNFPNPDKFDPDNFLPESCQKRHPFAYVPFSAGPRNCVGQKFALLEEKTMLASILRKYKIKSVEKPEDIRHYAELILRSQTGIKVTMTPRY